MFVLLPVLACCVRSVFCLSICCTLCLCGGVLPPCWLLSALTLRVLFTEKRSFSRAIILCTTCDLNAGVTPHVALGSMYDVVVLLFVPFFVCRK